MIRALSSEPLNGRWLLTGLAGRGSSGTVYRGFDLVTESLVAIKTIRSSGAGSPLSARMLREFVDLSTIRHPNLVETYEIASAEAGPLTPGTPFFTMELLEEVPIGGVAAGPGAGGIARLALDLLAALGCVHSHGLVHNDLKPSNVLRGRSAGHGTAVKLSDLGLATRRARAARGGAWNGTLHYAAPERIAGGTVDQRADLYSLGVLLFEAATGALPFSETDPAEALAWHLRGRRPDESGSGRIGPALARVVGRLLAIDPAGRFPRARAAWDEIAETVPDLAGDPRGAGLWSEGPLCGRRRELQALAGWLSAAEREGGWLTIAGEPETGLSRFAREAELAGRAQGWAVHGWKCGSKDAPFAPFSRPLRDIILRACGRSPSSPTPRRELLALLGGPALWSAPPRILHEALPMLAGSIAGFLGAHPLPAPMLLVLDDFECADEGTRLVLQRLSSPRDGRPQRLVVVTTVHEAGAIEGPRTRAQRAPRAPRLSLRGRSLFDGIEQSGAGEDPSRTTTAPAQASSGSEGRRGPCGPARRSGRLVCTAAHRLAARYSPIETLAGRAALLRLAPLPPGQARVLLERLPGIEDLRPRDLDALVSLGEGRPGKLVRLAHGMSGRQRTLFPPLREPPG